MPGLLDEDGSAVVIHADPDDHRTQPIGGSGARVGCGIIGMNAVAVGM
jgi:Cu-Zn family superoxide dismutase